MKKTIERTVETLSSQKHYNLPAKHITDVHNKWQEFCNKYSMEKRLRATFTQLPQSHEKGKKKNRFQSSQHYICMTITAKGKPTLSWISGVVTSLSKMEDTKPAVAMHP